MTLTNQSLRELERQSIRGFVEQHAELLTGRVLDFGAGRSPFRDVVEGAGGVYIPYDREHLPANVSGADVGPDETEWGDVDAVLFNQVAQYVPDLADLLGALCDLLRGGDPGALVATGPTNWPWIEPEDLHRHTPTGIAAQLDDAGFLHATVEPRWSFRCGDIDLLAGWQCVAYP